VSYALKEQKIVNNPENAIILIAIGAVAFVLILGLINMLRGHNANRSQTLMRWRVILQFVAIVILMAAVWWKTKQG
jgi:hypothetical protein